MPLANTRWVSLTLSSLCLLFLALPSINKSNIKSKILGNAENQTRGCRVRSRYATSVLKIKILKKICLLHRFAIPLKQARSLCLPFIKFNYQEHLALTKSQAFLLLRLFFSLRQNFNSRIYSKKDVFKSYWKVLCTRSQVQPGTNLIFIQDYEHLNLNVVCPLN